MNLFDIDPVSIEDGALIDVQCIWGTERCRLVSHERVDGYPVYRVRPAQMERPWDMGDTYVVNVARVTSAEPLV